MKKIALIILGIVLFTNYANAQERSGIYLGLTYFNSTHKNPYVYVSGNEINPTGVTGFDDKTTEFYIPFGFASYSKNGFSEFSTYALHNLIIGGLNLLSSKKQYVFGTDHTYSGDSYADGYIPVFSETEGNIEPYWDYNTGKGLEASYTEKDLLRFAFATNAFTEDIKLPVMLGLQGGVGGFGVHFASVEEGHEPSDANNDHTGLVNFNDAVDLYFGANVGFATEITGGDLAQVSFQYDWHFFIKGAGDGTQLKGNRITVELTYFPFDEENDFLKNMFFKGFFKHNSVPYMKKFAETIETTYSNTTIGLGISYFIL